MKRWRTKVTRALDRRSYVLVWDRDYPWPDGETPTLVAVTAREARELAALLIQGAETIESEGGR